ncbi:MAG: hypothetical protein NTU94_04985, partial [Planctomycetota bacterium]|nr:hypothetical protein [Planctomycetota bacterium]
MAYVEIKKDGQVVSRRPLDEEKAKAGCAIRLGQAGETFLSAGQSAQVGPYEVAVFSGDPPADAPPVRRVAGPHLHKPGPDALDVHSHPAAGPASSPMPPPELPQIE